jgi:hypothetical protein
MMKPARLLSIATVAVLAACGSDSSTGPSATAPVDLATAFSEMAVPGLSAAASLAGGVSTPTTATLPSGCTYTAASQSFVCPPVTSSGLTITSNYTLLDAAGTPMSQFDAKTVGSLRVRNTIAGTVSVEGDHLTIEGQQDQTLSGLQTSAHTLNGTSTLNMSGTGSSTSIFSGAFSIKTTTTTSNVVLPAHGASNSYPSSGTVTLDEVSSGTGLSLTARIVLTFNGTSKVGVAMTVDGHVVPGCTIDLSKSAPTCG